MLKIFLQFLVCFQSLTEKNVCIQSVTLQYFVLALIASLLIISAVV